MQLQERHLADLELDPTLAGYYRPMREICAGEVDACGLVLPTHHGQPPEIRQRVSGWHDTHFEPVPVAFLHQLGRHLRSAIPARHELHSFALLAMGGQREGFYMVIE